MPSLPTVLTRISLVAACGLAAATAGAAPARSSAAAPAAAPAASDPTLAAAGDIIGNCTGSSCGYRKTATVIKSLDPTTVLALGDISNRSGWASDYTSRFNSSWGVFKAKIRPVPGNHDYLATGAKNYFNYFGAAANPPRGYYSFDVGTWHIIAINSNCSKVGGCGAGSAQEKPIFQDLYNARADVVLSGHSHDYERFARQNNASQRDDANGIRQFVVGTGGSFFTRFFSIKPNSQKRNNNTFGVLRMTLGAGSYSWKFLPVAGKTFTDSGTTTCHHAALLTARPAG